MPAAGRETGCRVEELRAGVRASGCSRGPGGPPPVAAAGGGGRRDRRAGRRVPRAVAVEIPGTGAGAPASRESCIDRKGIAA